MEFSENFIKKKRMYKIKNFSSSPEIYKIEQREYNVVSDIYHSGLKRTLKKNIGRARRSIGTKLENSMLDDYVDLQKFHMDPNAMTTPGVTKKLVREAKKRNARVLGGGKIAEATSVSKNVSKDTLDAVERVNGPKARGKVENAIKSNDYIIFHSKGADSLAHEIGHVDNMQSKNPIKRLISKVANDPKTRMEFYKDTITKKSGFGEAAKRYLKGKAILAEETNASKKGLELLKKGGATKDELKAAKENLLGSKGALQTYKDSAGIYYKYPLRNKIQIPSRRGRTMYDWTSNPRQFEI